MAEEVGETRGGEGKEKTETMAVKNKLKERKISWAKLRRVDSLNLEAGRVSKTQHNNQVSISSNFSSAS